MLDIVQVPAETGPADVLRQLGLYYSDAIDPRAFARDNYFNPEARKKVPESKKNALGQVDRRKHRVTEEETPQLRLHANSRLAEVFTHIVQVGIDRTLPDLEAHLDAIEETYANHRRTVQPFERATHLEQLLDAYDQYIFDRHGVSITFQTEAVANFGRYAIYTALQDPLHEAS